MKIKNIAISILIGLLLAGGASLAAGAQYAPQGGDQIYVNQPYNAEQPGNIVPPASMAPNMGFAYPYAAPYAGVGAAYECGPVAAPIAAPCGPFTAGYEFSAQQSSAFGPFTPPVAQASEQFYQYPGLTPYGPYPGSGYLAAGGVGFDPVTGYYGPYGMATPLA